MNKDTYMVVLSGDPAEYKNPEDVKKRMAALFKTSMPTIEKFFSRNKTIVKKDLDMETAKRYVRAIEKTGAVCFLKKMAPPAETPGQSESSRDARAKPDSYTSPEGPGLKVIPVQTAYKGEDRFFPTQIEHLSASPNGLNINHDNLSDVAFSQINALAAYSPAEADEDSIRFLIFLKNRERPFAMDHTHIAYDTFQENPPPKFVAAFRAFLHFLCRQNTTMILEETTFDFLSGNALPRHGGEKAMKYATAIGRLIEEGSEGEEG